jgi:hypothetical protein
MKFNILNQQKMCKVKGHDDFKIKYEIEDQNGNIYCVLLWNILNENPIVYDKIYDNEIMKYKWYLGSSGYASNNDTYLHTLVSTTTKKRLLDATIVYINLIYYL